MIRCSHKFDRYSQCSNEAVAGRDVCSLHATTAFHSQVVNTITDLINSVNDQSSSVVSGEHELRQQIHGAIALMAGIIAELQSKVREMESQAESTVHRVRYLEDTREGRGLP